jgi:hypothetical protein
MHGKNPGENESRLEFVEHPSVARELDVGLPERREAGQGEALSPTQVLDRVALVVHDQGLALPDLQHGACELLDHKLDHLGLEGAVRDALLPALALGDAGGERVPREELLDRQVPPALDLGAGTD